MGRKKLLDKKRVVDAIHGWIIEHGTSPTVDELRMVLRVGSSRTVLRYLNWLEAEGDIERWAGARGMKLLRSSDKGLETVAIPILGEVPAGPFMVAEENIDGWVRLPKDTLRPGSSKFFLLRVRGNSMNKALVEGMPIENGDLVLVRRQSSAESKEIVVALIDGEATIKRFERGPGYFVLRPQSTDSRHQPIVVNREFSLAGVVCGILKKGSEALSPQN